MVQSISFSSAANLLSRAAHRALPLMQAQRTAVVPAAPITHANALTSFASRTSLLWAAAGSRVAMAAPGLPSSGTILPIALGLLALTASSVGAALYHAPWLVPFVGDRFLAGRDFSGRELSGINLAHKNLFRTNFERAHLEGARLSGATLAGAYLEGAYLMRAHLEDAHLEMAHLEEAHLEEAHLEKAHLARANLEMAHLEGGNLERADLEGVRLYKANLEGARLYNVYLVKANLEGAHLERAILTNADLRNANLSHVSLNRGTLLDGANFEGSWLHERFSVTTDNRTEVIDELLKKNAYLIHRLELLGYRLEEQEDEGNRIKFVFTKKEKANLEGAYLVKANLEGAHLEEANLAGAHLYKALLQGAHLQEAHLQEANLTRANLNRANLTRAHLEEARLGGANLEEARLEGATLTNAILNNANLSYVSLSRNTILDGSFFEGAFINDFILTADNRDEARDELFNKNAYLIHRLAKLGYRIEEQKGADKEIRFIFTKKPANS
jgi:uncharacterized protein YjbI with pentapeptide repeats